ncbi:transcription termination factor MTERF8, chloroplastic-like isoform X2 [Musa acuminata AAA Group]|uniref:transcription termination factor MTERF8, chloroplastic-like isoform X2 n=1 Tax=Musa acuminata AAA Group TaxID=214697 RepID=UPI0031D56AD0
MKRLPAFSLFSKTLCFIYRPRPADALLSSSSSYSVAATGSGALQPSFMAEYLVTSCGFSPENAAKASNLLGGIASRRQPDSVLGFLKSHGFDDTHVKELLSGNPRWLLLDVETTLAAKFRTLQELGFSQSDITHLLVANPSAINYRVRTVVHKIQFWQGLIGSNDLLIKLFKTHQWILGSSIEKKIQPNIEMLRSCGFTGEKLRTILRYQPTLVTLRAETLRALISRAEGFGVARTSGRFHWILWTLSNVSVERFNAQKKLFGAFGWSEADFLDAFRKTPGFLACSLKNLKMKMEFFVNEAGYAPSYIALRPVLLTFSFEKRLIPRYQLMAALKSRGLCAGHPKSLTYMLCPEKKFLERFVACVREPSSPYMQA